LAAHAGRRKRSLGAGMAATHDNDIEFGRELHAGLMRRRPNDT
jgi:hypothetical protein